MSDTNDIINEILHRDSRRLAKAVAEEVSRSIRVAREILQWRECPRVSLANVPPYPQESQVIGHVITERAFQKNMGKTIR